MEWTLSVIEYSFVGHSTAIALRFATWELSDAPNREPNQQRDDTEEANGPQACPPGLLQNQVGAFVSGRGHDQRNRGQNGQYPK